MDNRNIHIVWLDNEQETFENVAGVEVDGEKVSLFQRGQHPTPFFVAPLVSIRYYTISPGTGPNGSLPTPLPTGPITEYTSPEPVVQRALELINREHERRCLEVTQMDAGDEGSWVRCTKDRDHAGNLHTAPDLRWWTS